MTSSQKVVEIESVNLESTNTENKKPTFETIYNSTLSKVKEKVSAISIRPSTLHLIIKYVMEEVEKTPIKGAAQMDFALRIIDDLIKELPDSDETVFLRQTMDNGGIKDTIELVIQATKGEINVNKVTEVAAKNCLQPCIDYIISKCYKN